jgi:hypothetical protein
MKLALSFVLLTVFAAPITASPSFSDTLFVISWIWTIFDFDIAFPMSFSGYDIPGFQEDTSE